MQRRTDEWTKTKNGIRNYYGTESKVYLKNRPWMEKYLIPKMIKLVGDVKTTTMKPEESILVVGTGPGWLEKALPNLRFVSIDISLEMARLAGAAGDNVNPIVASGEYLPFRDKSFSFITAARALKFMDILRFLDEARRELRADGTLLLVYDCGDALWVRFLERMGLRVDPGSNDRTLRSRELQSLLREAGLAINRRGAITTIPLSFLGKLPGQFLHDLANLDRGTYIGRLSFVLVSRRSETERA